jgi:hypothetical protein
MSESGVPAEEIAAKDFIIVRPALVKRVGGANEALVWARVFYRCDEDSRVAHDTDSGRWWAATYATVGEETGLSPKQARAALDSLVGAGFLLREQHALRNNYDRAYSYQPVVFVDISDVPKRANGSAQTGAPDLPKRANDHVPKRANVPSSRDIETTTDTSAVAAVTTGERFAQPLCDVLVLAMHRNEAKVPSPLPKKWLDDARLMIDRDGRDPHQAKALIEWAANDSFWRSNILSMPTFRKQYDKLRLASERDSARAPLSKVEKGRAVDEELARRELEQQRAVAS